MRDIDIQKLIDKAKSFALNSFVPHTGVAIGACVLSNENVIFGGCTIENVIPSASFGASTVAILKAVSEGQIDIDTICIYQSGEDLPLMSGTERDVAIQFGRDALIIFANDERYETCKMYELVPFSKREELV